MRAHRETFEQGRSRLSTIATQNAILPYHEETMNRRPPIDGAIEWLLDGDPAIRWQTLRDLVGAAESTVAREPIGAPTYPCVV
jgi:hypothetical protein